MAVAMIISMDISMLMGTIILTIAMNTNRSINMKKATLVMRKSTNTNTNISTNTSTSISTNTNINISTSINMNMNMNMELNAKKRVI